ncbi:hypothetical protein A2U01_0036451, partial [Trifolium medium]|nr:hypothetical protein [Trifolium medium]
MEIIAAFAPVDAPDSWLWLGDGITGFTVKSAYLLLENSVTNRHHLEPVQDFVFKRLWKCAAPSKVRAFAWWIESAVHLFLHCDYVTKVWYDITRWLGVILIIPPNLATSFAMWATCSNNKKEK